VLDTRCHWDGAGDRWVQDDEFAEELRPAGTADILGLGRQGVALDPPKQRALTERSVDDHADASVARQRQEAILGLPVEDVVGELDEVERLPAYDALELEVAAPFRGGDPDMAELARRLMANSVCRCSSQARRLWT
jgi:hypothetical protein